LFIITGKRREDWIGRSAAGFTRLPQKVSKAAGTPLSGCSEVIKSKQS